LTALSRAHQIFNVSVKSPKKSIGHVSAQTVRFGRRWFLFLVLIFNDFFHLWISVFVLFQVAIFIITRVPFGRGSGHALL